MASFQKEKHLKIENLPTTSCFQLLQNGLPLLQAATFFSALDNPLGPFEPHYDHPSTLMNSSATVCWETFFSMCSGTADDSASAPESSSNAHAQ